MRKIRFGLGPKMRGFLRASIIACAATVGCALALTPGQRAVLLAGVGSFVQQGTTPWLTTETNSAAILAAVQGAIPTQVPTVSIGGVGIIDSAGTNKATVKAASTAPVATDTSFVTALNPNSPGIIALGGATTANSLSTVANSQYPANSVTTTPTPASAKATGTTGAVTATIAGVISATNYLCGFDVSYIGGTAAVGPVTVTGLLGGTWTYQLDVASATVGKTFSKEFSMCVPASATNTAIAVVTTADGTATAVDVQLHGYTL